MNRIPSLDGLRAFSILLVLAGHLAGTKRFLPDCFLLDDAADFGVRVFFVISGYLITLLLLQERHDAGRISLKAFYRRRAFRILPAAYVYIAAIVVFSYADISKREIIASCLYVVNFNHVRWTLAHLWSLSVEEQFYLLWPAVLVFFYHRRKAVAIGAIAIAPALRAVFYLHGWKDVNHYFPTVADAMAAGCLLAMVGPRLAKWDAFFTSRWFLVVPVAAAGMLLVDYWNRKVYNAVGLTIMHACIALSIYVATQRAGGILNWAPLAWLGRASYSLYLWQMPFCDRYSHGWWAAFPANLFLSVTCACCSLYLIEQPAINMGKFRSRRTLETAPVPEQPFVAPTLGTEIWDESGALCDVEIKPGN